MISQRLQDTLTDKLVQVYGYGSRWIYRGELDPIIEVIHGHTGEKVCIEVSCTSDDLFELIVYAGTYDAMCSSMNPTHIRTVSDVHMEDLARRILELTGRA